MSFHFKLEGLLRVRRLQEEQARDRLDQSMMRIRAIENSIEQAKQWGENTARNCSVQETIPASELQFVESVLQKTRTAIEQCRRQKQAEEQRAAELRTAYLLARRALKTLETLRDSAFRQYQTEQVRREQLSLDEMFLGRLLHARNTESSATAKNQNQDQTMTGI